MADTNLGKAAFDLIRAELDWLLTNVGMEVAKDGMAKRLADLWLWAQASGEPEDRDLVKSNFAILVLRYKFQTVNEANAAFGKFIDILSKVAGALIPVVPL